MLAGLVLALNDNNPRVSVEAIGLATLLSPAACSNQEAARIEQLCAQIGNVLIDNINSREPEVRRAAMHALGRLRYTNAVQALLDQFSYYQKGPDATAALAALAGIGHGSAASVFEQAVASSNADWRRLGVEGLARSGNREALAALQQLGQSERSSEVLLALHFANAQAWRAWSESRADRGVDRRFGAQADRGSIPPRHCVFSCGAARAIPR